MKLTINNRILILNLLPRQGDITMLKQLRVLKEDLSFTDKEKESWNLDFDAAQGMVKWDEKKVKDVDINISERMQKLMATELKKLNKAHKLEDPHLELWEMFCEKKDSEK
jgi:hypothetical protein